MTDILVGEIISLAPWNTPTGSHGWYEVVIDCHRSESEGFENMRANLFITEAQAKKVRIGDKVRINDY